MQLMLTRHATEAIKGLAEMPGADGVRISVATRSLNGHGPALEVELAGGADPGDAVVEAEGARVYLAPEATEAMDGKVLDADIDGREVHFAILVQEAPGGEPGGQEE